MKKLLYTDKVRKELTELISLASERQAKNKVREISGIITKGKKENKPYLSVLSEIRKTTDSPDFGNGGKDISFLISEAVNMGLLSKGDFSPEAWDSVDFLITIAEI